MKHDYVINHTKEPLPLKWCIIHEKYQHVEEYERLQHLLHCQHCGSLEWTLDKYGCILHKENCPSRRLHQGKPY